MFHSTYIYFFSSLVDAYNADLNDTTKFLSVFSIKEKSINT